MSTKLSQKSCFERRRYYSYRQVPQTSKHMNNSINRFTSHEYEKVIQELLEKISHLESRLVETGMDKIKIIKSHKKLSIENDYLIKEVKNREKKNQELQKKNLNSSMKIESINKYFKDLRLGYDNKVDMMLKQLRQKNEDINELMDKMKLKDNKILDMKINNDITNKEYEKQINEINMLKLTNKTLEEKIDKLQNELSTLYLEKKSEGNLLMENKHLKDDNVRLVELLSLTEEFANFSYLNSSLPGGVRYLSEIKIKELPPRMREKIVKNRIETLNSWIPGKAYDIVLEFNCVHNLNMDEVLINELLYKLNTIFREKEEKNIAKINTKYQKQILNLMERYGIKNISTPYNVLEVEKVKKNVNKKLRSEIKKEQENKKRQERADDITNFTKTATSHFFYNHKKKLDEQISNLREKLSIKTFNNNILSAYNKTNIITCGSVFKTSNGTTADSLSPMEKTAINNLMNSLKLSFKNLEKEFKDRVKEGKDMTNIENNVEWFTTEVENVLKENFDTLIQNKK